MGFLGGLSKMARHVSINMETGEVTLKHITENSEHFDVFLPDELTFDFPKVSTLSLQQVCNGLSNYSLLQIAEEIK